MGGHGLCGLRQVQAVGQAPDHRPWDGPQDTVHLGRVQDQAVAKRGGGDVQRLRADIHQHTAAGEFQGPAENSERPSCRPGWKIRTVTHESHWYMKCNRAKYIVIEAIVSDVSET